MASNEPSQVRAVDPFASYDSSSVNNLTKAITRGQDGIYATSDLDVATDDATATILYVSTGTIVKDNVLIELSAQHTVDFRTLSHYLNNFGATMSEVGFYYVLLDYSWQKANPPPTARIKILRPSERADFISGNYPSGFFLKAAKVENVGGSNIITRLYDYDPENTSVEREYYHLRINTEINLPTHSPSRDEGRIVYERSVDKFWFGFEDRWEEISAGVSISINTDSTGVLEGMLCYADSNGNAQPASLGSFDTRAEFIVAEVGSAESGNGRGKIAGSIESVLVEDGALISVGDVLYLSSFDEGKVTNVRTSGVYQVVGRALTAGSSTTPVTVLFFPGDIIFTAISGSITAPTDWIYDSTSTFYYYDVNVNRLNLQFNACLCETFVQGFKVYPADIEIRDSGITVRIYMPDNTQTVDYIVSDGSGGAGSGGAGGGASSHALLTNLDYASSGHTGFSPSPHDNTHHSQTFITASGVTYGNLNANADVGNGATQVAQGNHDHQDIIQTGSTVLFENDVARLGYTLETSISDELVYITPGSATEPANPGGDLHYYSGIASTWTQPNHTHTTGDHTLSSSELPSHSHEIKWSGNNLEAVSELIGGPTARTMAEFSGLGASPTITGPTGGGSPHNHGATDPDATSIAWRPKGRNFTRQTRN